MAERRSSMKRSPTTRVAYTPEEDGLLVQLKNGGLSWKEIHTQFTKAYFHSNSEPWGLCKCDTARS